VENSKYSQPITVNSTVTSGAGQVYAGGVTGLLTGTIKNTVVMANVTAKGQAGNVYGGGYAGSVVESGGISGSVSEVKLTVTAEKGASQTGGDEVSAGGLAGISKTTLAKNTVSGTLSITSIYYDGNAYSGGLVGKLDNASAAITESSITGNLSVQSYTKNDTSSGIAYAGGIVGYSTGNIEKTSFTGTGNSGGVSAGFYSSDSYSPTLTVTAAEAYAGGIAGYAGGPISLSYVSIAPSNFMPGSPVYAGIDARTAQANGIAAAGGISGINEDGISESYAVVTVKARAGNATSATDDEEGAIAGGISGVSRATISKTFALAQVDARPLEEPNASSKAKAGGIAGLLDDGAGIHESYAAGSVSAHVSSANAHAGGIAGFFITSTAASPAVKACVALQRYVASDGHAFRVVGRDGIFENNYAYEKMKSYEGGSIIVASPANGADENGDDIAIGAAIIIGNYVDEDLLNWDNTVWKASSGGYNSVPYPVLESFLLEPSFPSWAQLP
jgi:hypothetical protein